MSHLGAAAVTSYISLPPPDSCFIRCWSFNYSFSIRSTIDAQGSYLLISPFLLTTTKKKHRLNVATNIREGAQQLCNILVYYKNRTETEIADPREIKLQLVQTHSTHKHGSTRRHKVYMQLMKTCFLKSFFWLHVRTRQLSRQSHRDEKRSQRTMRTL